MSSKMRGGEGESGGDTHLSADQLESLRQEIVRQLQRLEQSMQVTDEGLRPVELDPGAVGRLSRIDELQNQALTQNLREREQLKLGALLQALDRLQKGTFGLCTECHSEISGGAPPRLPRDRNVRELLELSVRLVSG